MNSQVDTNPIRLGWKSAGLLGVVTVAGLGMFAWPLLIPATEDTSAITTPFAFVVLLPVLVLLVLAQIAERGIDAKALAILGVLSAVNAALRPLGAGTGGVETVFFLLILAGRVFGPGFGFVLGCTSLFVSALLTAGVGPWMPFQMMASAWLGMGAGLLPQRVGSRLIRGRWEVAMLVAYGVVSAYLFGAIMNLWFWPFLTGPEMGSDPSLSYVPGAGLLDNLGRFGWYTLLTSTAVWDTGRAITNAVLLVVVGPRLLAVLRRSVRRARFNPVVEFEVDQTSLESVGSPRP
ncbi:MAG: ECF transporter S component [Propionibacteriaceae bacterium]|nr:ECF transporter S component [Propionibacteriaceae bacterium]